MVTFRSNNNNRRPPFRSNNNRRPPFRRNDEGSKFSNNNSFKRNVPGRNNHNAPTLIEKYNEMAREALASEDRVLSENYFQHADHFTRVMNEQEALKKERFSENQPANEESPVENLINVEENSKDNVDESSKDSADEKVKDGTKVKKATKSQPEVN
jgi:hypothetical protein